jgi:15-cis-phytoene synthase
VVTGPFGFMVKKRFLLAEMLDLQGAGRSKAEVMNAALIEEFPAILRLALAYAPRSAKPACAALLALDRQLGSIARTSSEPMLAQLRYAWWRDSLAGAGGSPGRGNAVLDAAGAWGERRADLIALVDGWEALVTAENLVDGALRLADARANAVAALAALLVQSGDGGAAALAGRQWALADLVQNLSAGPARDELRQALVEISVQSLPLPRALRTFAILATLARRQAAQPDNKIEPGPAVLLSIVRTGLFGR